MPASFINKHCNIASFLSMLLDTCRQAGRGVAKNKSFAQVVQSKKKQRKLKVFSGCVRKEGMSSVKHKSIDSNMDQFLKAESDEHGDCFYIAVVDVMCCGQRVVVQSRVMR